MACGEVEGAFATPAADGSGVASGEGAAAAAAAATGTPGGGKDKQKVGMDAARWRERVRRAARRVVVLDETGAFEAVQGGRVVEPSFAKGEWGVRFVER